MQENSGIVSGPLVNQARLIREFLKLGHKIQVLCLWDDKYSPTFDSFKSEVIHGDKFNIHRYTDEIIMWILKSIKKFEPDIFLTDWIVSGMFASRWIKKAGIPVICSHLSDHPYFWKMMDLFASPQSKKWSVSGIACVSKKIENDLHKRFKKLKARTCYLPPLAKSVGPFEEKKLTDRVTIAYVGRFEVEAKQILRVTSAFLNLAAKYKQLDFILIGNGPDEEKVYSLVRQSSLCDRINIRGFIHPDELHLTLKFCHIVVLLSDYEGTPGALIDAMCLGVVPVCLNCPGGVDELVINEKTGLLIEDREESFYQAIDRLLYDDELYQRLSRFAVQHIKRNFDSSLVAEKWLSFSLQCIGVSPRKKTLKLPRKIKFPKMDNDQGFIHHPPSYFQTFLSNFKIYLGYLKKEILVRLNFE